MMLIQFAVLLLFVIVTCQETNEGPNCKELCRGDGYSWEQVLASKCCRLGCYFMMICLENSGSQTDISYGIQMDCHKQSEEMCKTRFDNDEYEFQCRSGSFRGIIWYERQRKLIPRYMDSTEIENTIWERLKDEL